MTNEEKMVWAAAFAAALDSSWHSREFNTDRAFQAASDAVQLLRTRSARTFSAEQDRRAFLGLPPASPEPYTITRFEP